MTLRARLTASFVLVVLVPLLVVVALATTVLQQVFADRQAQGMQSAVRLASAVVGDLCSRSRAAVEAAGRAYDGTSTAGLPVVLEELVNNGLADGVLVVDPAGRELGSAGSALEVPAGGDCTAGVAAGQGGSRQVAASVRLARSTGPAGTAVAAFDLDDALAQRLRDLTGDGEVVLVVDGEVVARSGEVPTVVTELAATPPREPLRAEGQVVVWSDGDGGPVGVLLWQPEGDGVGLLDVSLLVLLAVLGAAGLGLLTARAATRPLEELSQAAGRIAQGDLSTTIEVRSADEVGRLATAFNAMTEDLRSYVGALQASRDELQAGVARLGDTLSGTHDLDRILTVVLDAAVASTRAQAGAVLLLSGDRTELELVVEQGLRERGVEVAERLPVGTGVVGRVARTGEPALGRVGLGPGRLQTHRGEPTGQTLIVVPLMSSSSVIGVLALVDRTGGEDFGDPDLATLRTFTSQATVAVDNVLLHQEARRLSITDGLTGLWNYRYFQMTVAKEVERAARFDRPLALLMLDLDHFKVVNDTHGHQRGDAVLVELAARLRGLVRDVDTLARYGGEEFIAVLPETDEVGASLAADRIRCAVAARPFGGPGELPLELTVSAGVAVFPTHGVEAMQLQRAADDALYAAKRSGRNAWRLAEVRQDVEHAAD